MHIQVEGMNSDNFVMDYGDYGEVMFPLPTALGPGSILVRPIVATFFFCDNGRYGRGLGHFTLPLKLTNLPHGPRVFFPILEEWGVIKVTIFNII